MAKAGAVGALHRRRPSWQGKTGLWASPWVRALVGFYIVLLAVLPIPFGDFGYFIGQSALVYGVLGLSVVILTGYVGLVSLMTYSFVGIGAIVTGLAMSVGGWPFWLALPLAALATIPVSVIVGVSAVRLKPLYLTIATLTFSHALGETFFSWNKATNDLEGWPVTRPRVGPIDFADDLTFYLFLLVVVVSLVWMVDGLRRSRFGRAMLAVRDNELEAQALGINVHKTKLVAFVLSGMMSGLSGSLLALFLATVTAPTFQSPNAEGASMAMLTLVVVGGKDRPWGAFFAAIGGAIASQLFKGTEAFLGFWGLYGSTLLIWFLMKRPGGLSEVLALQFDLIRRRPLYGTVMIVGGLALNIVAIYLFVRLTS